MYARVKKFYKANLQIEFFTMYDKLSYEIAPSTTLHKYV